MRFQISGLAGDGQLWIVYANNRATAEHMAAIFRKEGYSKVTINEQEPI
jgi:hypothetical protein